jgi:hypothetical protein
MKNETIIITILAFLVTATSCKRTAVTVPSVVKNALQVNHADAQEVEWEKTGKLYEAEFIENGKEITVLISDAGRELKRKEEVLPAEIPPPVQILLRSSYGNYKLDDAEKVSSEGGVFYQVELEARAKQDVNLVINAEGQQASTQAYWD